MINLTVIELGSRVAIALTKENMGNKHYRQLEIVLRQCDQFEK